NAPPPHPFAQTGGQRPPGIGLAVAAMAVGLVALLTTAVSSVTFSVFVLLGALLGLVAVVLGIIALVVRQRRAPGLVGLIAGGLAVVLAIALGGVALAALIAPDGPSFGSGSGTATSPEAPDESASPDAGDATRWPANMATGGLVFAGGSDGPELLRSDAPQDDALPEPLDAEELGQPTLIRVYLDYRCPYCAAFEETNEKTLEAVASSGAAAVELVPLTFLDRVSSDAYSSRAAGAMACVADAQPEDAWAAHAALLDPSFQPPETEPGHDDDAIIAELDRATGGLSDETRDCIGQGAFVPFALALNDWVFANPVPYAADPELQVTGTPFVVVDGEPYSGPLDDAGAFRDFLTAQGVDLRELV
ncbi:MAG: thioredoxin domain-containing protein, partial [Leucobacter sp.]